MSETIYYGIVARKNIKMVFSYLFPLLFPFMILCCSQNDEGKSKVSVTSPNGNHSFILTISNEGKPFYSVNYKEAKVIGSSLLGFEIIESEISNLALEIQDAETKDVKTSWKPVYGEKNEYPDNYSETLIKLSGKGAFFDIRVRAYNEGVAFRYEFKDSIASKTIRKELTEFKLSAATTAWASRNAQGKIDKTPVSKIDSVVERPLLAQLSDSVFVAIGEAALVDFARMKLKGDKTSPGTLSASLSGKVVLGHTTNKSPWRFVMAGSHPGEILENNYLLLNLNEPNKIDDTDYIRPGKIIRELTLGTEAGLVCVDIAVKHNLQYIDFDADWYGNEYDDASDATTVTVDPKRSKENLDLKRVIDYANEKGIGVILYVNRRALEKQLDEVLPLLKKWGVAGIKYGFVKVGSQKWTSWLHDAVRKAAEHELMVDVHDKYRPTGYSRTYPNLMTQEGIRGDEESPDNAQVTNTIFTRMIAGSGDQTNCYFAPRVTEKMGSHASQLAKAVCIYSPWQFLYWYDRPQGAKVRAGGAGGSNAYIKEVPELAWFDALPTVWDDTKVIGGYPGEYAIVARRKGKEWFIGAINAEKERDIRIPLEFLEQGKKYTAVVYTDDPKVDTVTHVRLDTIAIDDKTVIDKKIGQNNGLAIHIKMVD